MALHLVSRVLRLISRKNKVMSNIKLLVAACLVVFGMLPAFALARASEDIDSAGVARLLQDRPGEILILDVRRPAEYARGHLPGAINIDFLGPDFEGQLEGLPKDRPVIVYCRSGRRSAGATRVMEDKGFKHILHMHAGYGEWEKMKLPVATERAYTPR